jgi:hypothetical protein
LFKNLTADKTRARKLGSTAGTCGLTTHKGRASQGVDSYVQWWKGKEVTRIRDLTFERCVAVGEELRGGSSVKFHRYQKEKGKRNRATGESTTIGYQDQ